MYGFGQFHHQQNKGEERRGEIWQKKQQLLSKHRAAADGKNSKKNSSIGPFLTRLYPLALATEKEKTRKEHLL